MLMQRQTRRQLLVGSAGLILTRSLSRAATEPAPRFSLPMGNRGAAPGDGMVILHGYACENVPFFSGWWHTGENWHLDHGETGGAAVYAVSAGDVIYSGSDYPGLVVILRHDDGLLSIYGHLERDPVVAEGDHLERGQLLGHVLTRTDGRLSHLHFEIRTFYEVDEINGASPSYGVHCGYYCPPGPGYWPMIDGRHPSEMGWRNPSAVIANRVFGREIPTGAELLATAAVGERASVWTAPKDSPGSVHIGDLKTRPGDRYPLREIDGGNEASLVYGADGYAIWYRIDLSGGGSGWVQGAIPSGRYTGNDGRKSTVRLRFVPAITTG